MEDVGQSVRVGLRPIATPLPLTFAGLLIASALSAGAELGWIPLAEHRQLGWVLLVIPIPLQLLAACWGFAARSAAAATGAAVLAGAWGAYGVALAHAPPSPTPSHALALLFGAAAAALLVPAAAAARTGAQLAAAVLALAGARFAVTCVAGAAQSIGWTHASGWLGLAVAAAALYAALALELESAGGGPVLPVFRTRLARRARDEPLEAQRETLQHEPGVRRAL